MEEGLVMKKKTFVAITMGVILMQNFNSENVQAIVQEEYNNCLLYTSDAADEHRDV